MPREFIDDDVWAAVTQHGKYGDTFSDAARRALNLPPRKKGPMTAQSRRPSNRTRTNFTNRRLDRRIEGRNFSLRFGDDPWKTWKLPADKTDKEEIRRLRDETTEFGKKNGATPGQVNAILKAFSDAGYYLTGPRRDDGLPSLEDLL